MKFVRPASVAIIFTARKRSLGQDNIITGVCLSTGEEVSLTDSPGQRPPPYGKERAVRILLECILVLSYFTVEWRALGIVGKNAHAGPWYI